MSHKLPLPRPPGPEIGDNCHIAIGKYFCLIFLILKFFVCNESKIHMYVFHCTCTMLILTDKKKNIYTLQAGMKEA